MKTRRNLISLVCALAGAGAFVCGVGLVSGADAIADSATRTDTIALGSLLLAVGAVWSGTWLAVLGSRLWNDQN
jgi:hypothetical protein